MSLIYVTGISGSGKSEALKELLVRGYNAHGSDEEGISAFYRNDTGEILRPMPDYEIRRTLAWREKHTWKMDRKRVSELADRGNNGLVFLCGVAANEDEVWDLFSGAIALVVDDETLRHRLATRTNNNFGKMPHELESIMEWQHACDENYQKLGISTVDGTRPIEIVVDEIVEKASAISGG